MCLFRYQNEIDLTGRQNAHVSQSGFKKNRPHGIEAGEFIKEWIDSVRLNEYSSAWMYATPGEDIHIVHKKSEGAGSISRHTR